MHRQDDAMNDPNDQRARDAIFEAFPDAVEIEQRWVGECVDCGRKRDIPAAPAGGRWRCRECGSTRVVTRPARTAVWGA